MARPGRPKGLPKTGGRKKGTPNKKTALAKEAAMLFLNSVSQTELARLWARAKKEDPNAALRVYYGALEFVAPKLQRREVIGDDKPKVVEVRHVAMNFPVKPVESPALPPKDPE